VGFRRPHIKKKKKKKIEVWCFQGRGGGVAEEWGLSNVTLRPLVNSDLRFEGLSNPSNLGHFDCEDEDKTILRNSGSM
jgi:hypothetical protein